MRGRGWNDSPCRRWTGVGCAAALALAWVALGHGGAPAARGLHDALAVAPVQAAPAPEGAAVYAQKCASCHQASGKGMPGTFPPLTGPVTTGDPHYLTRILLYGLQGRTVVQGQTYNVPMAGFAGQLNDTQIAQVLTYVRSSFGNSAAAVSEDVVKEERAKPGTAQDNYSHYPK